jgi:hypothetical protein
MVINVYTNWAEINSFKFDILTEKVVCYFAQYGWAKFKRACSHEEKT